jgi:hypothetical protein
MPAKADAGPGPELFIQLHAKYMATLQSHALGGGLFTVLVTTLYPGAIFLAILVNIVSGSCVTLWSLTFLVSWRWMTC